MRISSQNLTDGKQSLLAHGRAWFWRKSNRGHWGHVEWSTGRRADNFSIYLSFGSGQDDDSIMFHIAFAWLFSIWLSLDGICRIKKEWKTGIAIHDNSIWLYPASFTMETNSKDPWYRRCHSWSFPWQYDWYRTEVLEHKANFPFLAATMFIEQRGDKARCKMSGIKYDTFEVMRRRDSVAKLVSETYDYTYTLKSGEIQHRKATVYVDRMTWRMRWWPLLPFKKIRTCIDVKFDGEVGEGTGSWKGGAVGCGYEMLHGETPLETLRRMERERKFGR